MIQRRTIVIGMTAGIMSLGPLSVAAFADTASPSPTSPPPTTTSPSPTPSVTPATLTVKLTPDQVAQGGTVRIEASVAQGSLKTATATSPALGTVTLTPSGNSAAGTGHVGDNIKAGDYTVTVNAVTADDTTLKADAKLTVVVASPSPSPTSTVPKGGVKTGGGGTAGGADLALISAGAAIALLGVGLAVTTIKRRRADARH